MGRNTSTGSIIGAGTTFGYSNTSGGTYNLLAEMRDVKAPHQTADKYEATGYDSPSLYKEYIFGWKEGGEVDLQFNYLHVTQAALQPLLGVLQWFQVTLPNTHTWTFQGAIDDIAGDLPNKGVCDIKFKIKLTGAPVYA